MEQLISYACIALLLALPPGVFLPTRNLVDAHPQKAIEILLIILFIIVGPAFPLLQGLIQGLHLEGIPQRLLELGWFAYTYGWLVTLHWKHLKK